MKLWFCISGPTVGSYFTSEDVEMDELPANIKEMYVQLDATTKLNELYTSLGHTMFNQVTAAYSSALRALEQQTTIGNNHA